MKGYFKIIIYSLISAAALSLAVALGYSERNNRALKHRTIEQSKVIDSLLNRRIKAVDVQLYVTDKSKNTIYGKYNKGSIQMPQERKYILEVDSISIK